MFASQIARTQTKATESPTGKLAARRSAPQRGSATVPGVAWNFGNIPLFPPAGLNPAQSLDVLSGDSAEPTLPYLDQSDAGVPDTSVPAADGGVPAPDAGTPASAAVPTNLVQTVTAWTPGPDKYGFQLGFTCSSSSRKVADLQAQPTLKWREYVTYSRNDFKHRIDPPSPTILPPGGGISFGPGSTTIKDPNTLSLDTATDTHWMPTSAVQAEDYALTLANPRPLPAIMESSQLYQYSTDGATWTTFAGPFTLTRTFDRKEAVYTFKTDKAGIHSITEPYKAHNNP